MIRSFAFLLQAVASLAFTALYFSATGEGPEFRLQALTNFAVDAPFSHRILIPAIAHAIATVVNLTPFRIYEAITAGFLFVAMIAFSKLIERWCDNKYSPWLALLILYPMVFNYVILGDYLQPWDIPSIAFFILGLVAITHHKFWRIAVIIALATLNRETAAVIVLAYFLLRWRQPHFIRNTLGLALIWATIKGAIVLIVGSGAGSVYHNVTGDNLAYLANVATGDLYYVNLALRIFGGLHLLFACVFWLVPAEIKRLSWIAVAFPIPLFFTGYFTEERIFNELIPIFTLVLITAVSNALARSKDTLSQSMAVPG